ncbi:unnamed protein product, partial [Macrosiphum euphorbiae]
MDQMKPVAICLDVNPTSLDVVIKNVYSKLGCVMVKMIVVIILMTRTVNKEYRILAVCIVNLSAEIKSAFQNHSNLILKVIVQMEVMKLVVVMFITTCKAVGVPIPEISWRLNWGHVPTKCEMNCVNGLGTLTCPNIQEADQGAYSCEGINIHGSEIAVPDTILVVKRPNLVQPSACPKGTFNDVALSQNDCINCFCFGISSNCRSSKLFKIQNTPSLYQLRIANVYIEASSFGVELQSASSTAHQINVNGNEALQVFTVNNTSKQSEDTYPYFKFPKSYLGNQLKSYGGYITYIVRYEGNGDPITFTPDIILTGNGVKLLYFGPETPVGIDTVVSARLFVDVWKKESTDSYSNGLATREEVMMVSANVENILIRGQYVSQQSETNIKHIKMDSAQTMKSVNDYVAFVEECQCPAGYTGLSCE